MNIYSTSLIYRYIQPAAIDGGVLSLIKLYTCDKYDICLIFE